VRAAALRRFDWNQLGGPSGFDLLTHRIEIEDGIRKPPLPIERSDGVEHRA